MEAPAQTEDGHVIVGTTESKVGAQRKLMWVAVLAVALGTTISACGDARGRLVQLADNTRGATERSAARAAAADQARIAQIAEDAEPMREAGAIALGERYFVRAEGTGWSVVDRFTNRVASISGQPLERLSLDEAEGFANDLRADARRSPQ